VANSESWKVLDKQRLFRLVLEELAGDAHISFEGELRGLRLLSIPGGSEEETDSLKRNTSWPKQDFVVVPLEADSSGAILSAIGGALLRKIIHVQIEKAGVLEFGAYDQFQPGCIYFGGALNPQILEVLVSQGVLKTFTNRSTLSKNGSKSI
jgi:hypothetical protein